MAGIWRLLGGLVATVALFSAAVGAQAFAACTPEVEPNNEPSQIASSAVAPACATGVIQSGDQEMVAITVPSGAERSLWRVTLDLLPGQSAKIVLAKLEPPPADAAPDALSKTLGFDGAAAPTVLWQGAIEPGQGRLFGEALMLDPGAYLIGVTSVDENVVWRARLEAAGSMPPPLPTDMTQAASFRGQLTGTGEAVVIPWTLGEADAAQRWSVALQVAPRGYGNLNLIDEAGKSLTSFSAPDADGAIRLRDLGLAPGAYRLEITHLEAGVPAILSAEPEGPRGPSLTEEPDDLEQDTHMFALLKPWTGRLVSRGSFDDIDQFSFSVDEALSQRKLDISLRTNSEARLSLALAEVGGPTLLERTRVREVRLRGLILRPGVYRVTVRGTLDPRETYALALEDRGPIDPGAEREPNDVAKRAMPIAADVPVAGTFDGQDRDYLRLRIEGGLQLWDFTVIGEGLSSISLIDSTDRVVASESGRESSLRLSRLLLAPGDHTLLLEGEGGTWLARATPRGPPSPGEEIEPNDTPDLAMPLLFEGTQRLWLDRTGDADRYAFYLAAPHRVSLALDAPADMAANLVLEWPRSSVRLASVDVAPDSDGRGRGRFEGVLPAGDYLLLVRSNSGRSREPLTLTASLGPPFDTPAPGTAIEASVAFDDAEIAAFRPEGQHVRATLRLRNGGDDAVTVSPEIWFGDERWWLESLPTQISLDPGSEKSIPFTVQAAPDARNDEPIQIAIALKEGATTVALARAAVRAVIGANPVAPMMMGELPPELEGGIDVAWSALGASSNAPAATDGLLDGKPSVINPDEGLVVDLAGEAPVSIKGFVLVPPSGEAPEESVKRFAVEVLTEAGRFERVFEGTLSPLARAQGFVLPNPVSARSLRLVALERQWPQEGGRSTLSAFKVIGADRAVASGFDIARPELGGHIVWTEPQTEAAVTGESASWPGNYPVGWDEKRGSRPSFVYGFQSSRAALIDSVALTLDPQTPPEQAIRLVRVHGSTEGPFGPWVELGVIQPPIDGARRGVLRLATPTFVRHLKFQIEEPTRGDIDLPQSVEVIEHAADESHLSILGEWESTSSRAAFERQSSAAPAKGAAGTPGRDRASATPLPAETSIEGQVRRGEEDHWYRLDLPDDSRSLRLVLTGRPAVDTAVALEDAEGKAIALTPDPAEHGVYVAEVAGGAYYARLWQPSRSVVVAWDTSMSVGNFVPVILRAVRRLSADLEVGNEAINLVPFRGDGTEPLLGEFAETREAVWSALHGYGWGDSDSDAEQALMVSANALAARQGPRAIVLITDASSSGAVRNAELWRALDAARPRVFALHIATGEDTARSRAQTQLMQDWAYASGGFYSLMGSPGEAEAAFRRLAARLRAPADYGFRYSVSTAPPAPGQLSVPAPEAGSEAAIRVNRGAAISLILDASGSMLQRLQGRRKIEIAKSILTDLVTKTLPPSFPVSLRVFGQGGKGSCRSDLTLPLGPLDPAAAARAVARLRSTNGAKTAIAESLRLAGADLAAAEGRRRMILITDGEETCGGDPAKEIEALRAQGLDVQVNIVGFDVAEATVRATFEKWAQAGGGTYYDAKDQAALASAMREAVQPAFEALDAHGIAVGHGVVGGSPIELPPGRYRVRITADPPFEIDVMVKSSETTSVVIPANR